MRNIMAMVVGMIIPPPTAWMTRANTSALKLQARLQSIEPTTNTPMDRMYSLLKPNLSPSHPEKGTTTPSASM